MTLAALLKTTKEKEKFLMSFALTFFTYSDQILLSDYIFRSEYSIIKNSIILYKRSPLWKYSLNCKSKFELNSNFKENHADLRLFCQSSIWLNTEKADYNLAAKHKCLSFRAYMFSWSLPAYFEMGWYIKMWSL